jgi:hypothetical protein
VCRLENQSTSAIEIKRELPHPVPGQRVWMPSYELSDVGGGHEISKTRPEAPGARLPQVPIRNRLALA